MKQSDWMAQYEKLVTKSIPELTGKIDWITAKYLYDSGDTPTVAAYRTIKKHKS